MENNLTAKVFKILKELEKLSDEDKIDTINKIKLELHQYSPMKNEPVDCVIWVKQEEVNANDYNPNYVAKPEMELLQLSIEEDGYTQPIVVFEEDGKYEVVDGFHRNRVGREIGCIKKRIFERLPVTVINSNRTDKSDRIASTIRHNRARGKHQVDAMSAIVVDLVRRNWSDKKIAKEVGLDPDEILRLKQVSGLAELFTDKEFSQAWEMTDSEH
jgi:ParB-like chromosome segregation protein Spo0J